MRCVISTRDNAANQGRSPLHAVDATLVIAAVATCTNAPRAGPSIWATTSPARSARRCRPSCCISFFVTCRRSGAQPTHKMRFWRVGWAGPGGRACVMYDERRPAIESQASDGKGPGEQDTPLPGIGFQFLWSVIIGLLSNTLSYIPEHRSR